MKRMYHLLLFSVFVLLACKKEDDSNPLPPEPEVEDRRTEYTVSTLTEAFNGSGGATVDAAGFIYVADFGDQLNDANGVQVTKVDPETGELTVFAIGLVGPSGNAFDSEGNLFQANIKGNFVSKISPEGEVTTFVESGLSSPVGVVIDSEDNLFVCNCGSRSVSKITPEGVVSSFVVNTLLNCPNGITMDDEGNLYPVNFNNGNVLKVSPEGEISVFARIPGGSNAHIEYWNDKLYVVGRQAGQVFELDMDGNITLIAGSGQAGDQDGDGDVAQFHIPNGIALSNDGQRIYVVDRLQGVGTPLNPVVVRVIQKK